MPTRSLGQLERAVMDVLWATDEPMTAYDLRDALEPAPATASSGGSAVATRQAATDTADAKPAVTTVLTVLSRLAKKGFVAKDQSFRPHLFSATSTQEDHTAGLLHEILDDAPDREAVLARFIGGIEADEAAILRRILNARG